MLEFKIMNVIFRVNKQIFSDFSNLPTKVSLIRWYLGLEYGRQGQSKSCLCQADLLTGARTVGVYRVSSYSDLYFGAAGKKMFKYFFHGNLIEKVSKFFCS
jgi:hypothetical protein